LFFVALFDLVFKKDGGSHGFISGGGSSFFVLLDDLLLGSDLSLLGVSSGNEGVSLGGEVGEFFLPLGGFSLFPGLVGGLGLGDLSLQGVQKFGDLVEELLVAGAGSNLGERVDKRSVGGEFVIEMGHVFKSLGDGLDSTLELDEKSTSLERVDESDGLGASVNTGFVLGVEGRPGGVFGISLVLTGKDSGVDLGEFLQGGGKHFLGVSEKFFGGGNGGVTGLGLSVGFSDLFLVGRDLLGAEVLLLGVGGEGFSGLFVESGDEVVNHVDNGLEIVLSGGHVDRDLGEDGLTEWVGVDLSKDFHVLGLSQRKTVGGKHECDNKE